MHLRLLLAIMSVVIIVGSCDLFNNEQSEPEIPGKLVYSAPDKEGRYQIFVSNTDGTDIEQITKPGSENAEFFNPSWSNDGTQIALTSSLQSSSDGLSLYIMNADGSNLRPLKERPNSNIVTPGNNPVWNPDDSKIAFDWCTNCELGGNNYEIFVYDFDTDSIKQITDNPARDFFPQWRINKDIVSFSSNREYLNMQGKTLNSDLYEFSLTDFALSRITNNGLKGSWTWNPTNNYYLIRERIEPYEWYYIDPSSGDRLEIFTLEENIEESNFIPIKWSRSGQILMLLKIEHPIYQLRFYSFETKTLSKKNELINTIGFDWFFEK